MISVRLDKDLEKKLNSYAREQNISKSKIIKESLSLYFEMLQKNREKTPYELGKEFFGKYSSGKDDLSVTYKKRLKEKICEKNFNR